MVAERFWIRAIFGMGRGGCVWGVVYLLVNGEIIIYINNLNMSSLTNSIMHNIYVIC